MGEPRDTTPDPEDRDRRLDDLLLEAFALPDHEQRPFLEKACGDDPLLLEEALSCIELEENLGGFLEAPALEGALEPALEQLAEGRTESTFPARPAAEEITCTSAAETFLDRDRQPWTGDSDEQVSLRRLGRRELGAYRIVGHVGAGGMGQVYIGEDARLGRRVAVKILPPDMAQRPGWLGRFEREARTLATLNHPNIVTIHSIEEDRGIRFLTMELVEGRTLNETIPENGLALEDFLRIAAEMADALAAAHERGIVHRDLKPVNVMISEKGRLKILDFGIAKISEPDQAALSHAGQMLGTVPYMAPEQLGEEPVDRRSDLFSYGVVLFKMATGRHPFPARTTLERINAIVTREAPRLSLLRPDFPEAISVLVDRCLKKQPAERFQSAGEVLSDLETFQENRLAAKVLESHTDLDSVTFERQPGSPLRPWAVLVALAAVVVALALAREWFRAEPPVTVAAITEAPERLARTTLAVLFFQNLTGDPELDWLSTGIPELVVNDLAQSPELRVLDTSRIHRLFEKLGVTGSKPLPLEMVRQAAEAVEANKVMRGSYARLGDVFRITYVIEDPHTGETLRSEALDGQGEQSLFALADQLSAGVRAILNATRPDLGPETVKAATTTSLGALEAYSQAKQLSIRQGLPEQAVAKLEEALRLDPEFALAAVMVSKLHNSLGRTAEAERYAQSAFEDKDHLPLNTRFDVEGAYYATNWSTLGKAIETYDLALKVYPSERGWRNNLARRYAFFERYSEAIDQFNALIDSGAEFWGNFQGAANCHAALGDFEAGHRLLAQAIEEKPEDWRLRFSMAWHLSEWGRYVDAERAFDDFAELRDDTFHLPYGRWRLAVLRENWEDADREAGRLLAAGGAFARYRGNVSLAKNALYRGRPREALARFDDAVAVADGADRALVRCFQTELLMEQGDHARALEQARLAQQEGVGQWPELKGYYLAALAEQALGRDADADTLEETLRERWRRQPNAVEERQLYHLSGRLALARGKVDEALKALERAAALLPARGVEFSWHVYPDHVPVWVSLGEAELAAERPEKALEWLRLVSSSGAEHLEQPLAFVRGHYLEGLACRRSGLEEEAMRSFERFLSHWAEGDLRSEWVAEARSALE